jgi:arylformamidase
MTRKGITPDDLAGIDLSEDIRVLLKTHNSRIWGSPEFHGDFVGVTAAAAQHFVDRGVKLLGIDYLSIEVFRTPGAPAHHALLSAGVIVVEGLNLAEVEPGVYDMFCLPLRLVGSDGAPARVILRRS